MEPAPRHGRNPPLDTYLSYGLPPQWPWGLPVFPVNLGLESRRSPAAGTALQRHPRCDPYVANPSLYRAVKEVRVRTFMSRGFHIRSAASTAMLLALSLIPAGCNNPRASQTPSLNAYTLSAGKITNFIPTPGLPNSPTDKGMLMACRQLPVTSSTARSAFLILTAGQFGRVPLHALVVGKNILVLPGDLATVGIAFSGNNNRFTLYPDSSQCITLIHNSRTAFVGSKRINLQYPVVATASNDLVMTFSDMKTLFHERDIQRKQPPFFGNEHIIYNIRDYHR